ncbi:hypothetical protein M0R45_001802 [Rubus argutus]|uniref:TF-B3 domain-containing protein n=1 Tax=Rubus argutus TaxID=59490 RepID=A0AAW1VL05_RUBAR
MCFSIKIFDKNASHKLKEVKEKEHDYTNTGKSTSKSTERPTKTTSESSKRPRGRPRKYPVTCSDHLRPLNSCKENSGKILRLTQVYVAKPFYKENLSSGKYEFVFLKNSEGTKWYQVTLSSYRETAFMTKGWGAFALANQVRVGSLCQFQFLKQNKFLFTFEQVKLSTRCKKFCATCGLESSR